MSEQVIAAAIDWEAADAFAHSIRNFGRHKRRTTNFVRAYLAQKARIEADRAIIVELLEALSEVVRCEDLIENQTVQMYALDKEIELKAAVERARAVIAKAEGK